MQDLLEPHKPLLKFVVVKCVVFFTFWQAIVCALLVNMGGLQSAEEARETQNFLTALEMCIAMVGMHFAFPARIYAGKPTDSMRNNILHAASCMDVITDLRLSLMPLYSSYVLYTDDTQAATRGAFQGKLKAHGFAHGVNHLWIDDIELLRHIAL